MDVSDCSKVLPVGGQISPYLVFARSIEKFQQDDRDYRLIQLENGLQAMLIHDATVDQAAASLNVAVGHLSDPDDMPGMAHFCEHLLFMGTEPYPHENEYSEFLAKNNGSSNAYTTSTNTTYYFAVAAPAFAPALSRFAAFFHSPLFSPSCISRELSAVDSENKKNLQQDTWRIFQLNKHLSVDGHVWKKFGCGNRESLSHAARKINGRLLVDGSSSIRNTSLDSESEADGGAVGRETRRRLLEWWTREYCASRMRLCIIGNESLDQLANLASTLFSPIQNRGQDPIPMISEHPFGPNEKGTFVLVQTVRSFHAVEISFPLSYQPPHWRYKPAQFVAHFVGHEGPGSLHSYLKHKGWITFLCAEPQDLARGFSVFRITIRLTSEGFRNHDLVLQATFKYLALLRSSPFPTWYQQELAKLSTIRFNFSAKHQPVKYAIWVSEHMLWPVPPELLLSAPQVVWPWDEVGGNRLGEKDVWDVLESLSVDKGRVMLMARAEEHTKIWGELTQWELEPWYGTPHRVEVFGDKFIEQARIPNQIPELFLPGPNVFIPDNLRVEKQVVVRPLKHPHPIRITTLSTVWHKKDDQFWVPKAHINVNIQTPLANATARNWTLTCIYSELVNDALTESTYDANLAGLTYDLVVIPTGLFISVSGYNDKISVLTRHVVQKLRYLMINPERLEVMKEKVKRDWENFYHKQSYHISNYYGLYLLTEQQWTVEEGLLEISSVTFQEMHKHVGEILSNVRLSMLVTGNVNQEECLGIAEMVEGILDSSPLPCQVFERSNFVWRTLIPNPAELNSSLTYYVHIGRLTTQRIRIVLALLTQILTEPVFSVLRTKEQLGYMVSCTQWELPGSNDGGIAIVIQSERDPAFLEQRVDAFLGSMKNVIEEMGQLQFEEQKVGLERKWRESVTNLNEETSLYWKQVESGHLDFLRNEHAADLLKNIDKQDLLSLFLEHVHPSSATRAKLSVHMCSQMQPPQKVIAAAAETFEESVKQSEQAYDKGAWPRIGEVDSDGIILAKELERQRWAIIGEQKGAQASLQTIPWLIEKNPLESDATSRDGVTYIGDVKAFKASLTISECNEFCFRRA